MQQQIEQDVYYFREGTHESLYQFFGAHLQQVDGKVMTIFRVWAPNARRVSIVGSFNDWNGSAYGMKSQDGIWTLTIPGSLHGERYKYEVTQFDGKVVHKADPFAVTHEVRPQTASIVYDWEGNSWGDDEWMIQRRKSNLIERPVSIYEVHLGSWKRSDNGALMTYRDLATELIPYVKELGFTHIELMPILEHPFDGSWGYQATGYYAPTSRYGTPHDFMSFVDSCHREGIGVLLDWVPGHFCKDLQGLYLFDGTPTYEYSSLEDRENVEWGTAHFDLSKGEVRSFLLSSLFYWVREFHVDGFRFDAMSRVIYWPNSSSPTPNPWAHEWMQSVSRRLRDYDPGLLITAEDSTDWPHVTERVEQGGLGFTHKWNMGWMNDTLTYFSSPPKRRRELHDKLTFSMLYAFNEQYILPLSHDEVVHGKKSLLDKLPGTYEEKFAQLRLLLTYWLTHPGKKLLFMGTELAPFAEWKDGAQLDWHLLTYENHDAFLTFFKTLLPLYKQTPALFEQEKEPACFQWIDVNNHEQQILSWLRYGHDDTAAVVFNCSSESYEQFDIGVPHQGEWECLLHTDAACFGGEDMTGKGVHTTSSTPLHGKPYSLTISLPKYSAVLLHYKNVLEDERMGSL
ncbi:1,4-alpha-glucan branching protein GlgB [Bacillus fonticola]|uniref:1,4-alpha-glucan branching protein GlgB n=1 Tax=Bacillus fonticola TaxID=2728853 RepID=UPI001D13A252|nr:1,4-alpha-glucan branching protein GlgB [Bacillus fonticola]